MNKDVQDLVQQIRDKFTPEKIILFGSHAYGEPDENSDVDILVIMNFEGSARHQAIEILQKVDYHFSLDLIVRSMDQTQSRIKSGDFFLKDVVEKGKVLYDRNLS
jgi:predicted nucleotidyltransferase